MINNYLMHKNKFKIYRTPGPFKGRNSLYDTWKKMVIPGFIVKMYCCFLKYKSQKLPFWDGWGESVSPTGPCTIMRDLGYIDNRIISNGIFFACTSNTCLENLRLIFHICNCNSIDCTFLPGNSLLYLSSTRLII